MPDQPSKAVDRYWIQVWAPGIAQVGPRVGKWLVFVRLEEVDHAWATIERAVRMGSLGPAAKVRTSRSHPLWVDDRRRPICVYTADAADNDERERVRRALMRLGFPPERYKTDEETRLGTCGGR